MAVVENRQPEPQLSSGLDDEYIFFSQHLLAGR